MASGTCLSLQNVYPLVVSLVELQHAVSKLSPSALIAFSDWLEEHTAARWDRRIEMDLSNGKLDSVIRQIDEDIKAARFTPL